MNVSLRATTLVYCLFFYPNRVFPNNKKSGLIFNVASPPHPRPSHWSYVPTDRWSTALVRQYKEHVQTEFGYTPFFWETERPNTRTTGGECREYETDDQGRIVYYIPPQSDEIDKITIKVRSRSASTLTNSVTGPVESFLAVGTIRHRIYLRIILGKLIIVQSLILIICAVLLLVFFPNIFRVIFRVILELKHALFWNSKHSTF